MANRTVQIYTTNLTGNEIAASQKTIDMVKMPLRLALWERDRQAD